MPIHDWTRVDAGVWHGFHLGWIAELRRALNAGVLPRGYYADAEQRAFGVEPDILALEAAGGETAAPLADDDGGGGTATMVAPARVASPSAVAAPTLSVTVEGDEVAAYAQLRRTIVVRRANGDRVVALLEITSPGNKDRRFAVEAFADKAARAIESGVHVAIVDLHPPGTFDATGGLVGAVAAEAGFASKGFALPPGKPLCVASFEATRPPRLYAEPLDVGDAPPDLPLFYADGRFVDVPLSATYAAAYDATPRRWRTVIEGAGEKGAEQKTGNR